MVTAKKMRVDARQPGGYNTRMSAPSPPSDPVRTAVQALENLCDSAWNGLADYAGALLEANTRQDLLATCSPDVLWRRHLFDSLVLLPWIGNGQRVLDIGSGGGLPGLPLALCRPATDWVLLEATGRKAVFLAEMVEKLHLKRVIVLAERAETAGHRDGLRESFDLVVSRATAPLPVLLELAMPFLKTGGLLLAQKGARAEEEITAAGHALSVLGAEITEVRPAPALEGQAGCTLVVTKRTPTPDRYPRLPGRPAKKPL